MVEILRGIATLPAYVRRENLKNRILEAQVERAERDARGIGSDYDLGESLGSLPALQGDDADRTATLLVRDIERISESRLRIQTVQLTLPKESNGLKEGE